MLGENHYLNLFRSRNDGEKETLMLEIAMVHNALGVMLKDLFGKGEKSLKDAKSNLGNGNRRFKQNLVKQTQRQQGFMEKDSRRQQETRAGEARCKFQRVTQESQSGLLSIRTIDNEEESKSSQIYGVKTGTSRSMFNDSLSLDLALRKTPNAKLKQNLSKNSNPSSEYQCISSSSSKSKPVVYREGKKHNKSRQNLNGYSCQMCEQFYTHTKINGQPNGLCKHSNHQTTAAYTKINNYSQAFDNL